jgi:hypothetical protein
MAVVACMQRAQSHVRERDRVGGKGAVYGSMHACDSLPVMLWQRCCCPDNKLQAWTMVIQPVESRMKQLQNNGYRADPKIYNSSRQQQFSSLPLAVGVHRPSPNT